MPWTIIINKNNVFCAVSDVFSFDPQEAWEQAQMKYSHIAGMLKGDHAAGWISDT
jgi:hypothetical protein